MRKIFALLFSALVVQIGVVKVGIAQKEIVVKKKDRKKDVLLQTSKGDILLRLSDSTPLHRDNFLKLVKVGFYDSVLFHRVIKDFMIQGGDPNSRRATAGQPLGSGGPGYTIPAEFRSTLFHKKGAIAASKYKNLFLYEPLVSEEECIQAESQSFLDRIFDGSVKPLLVHFAKSKKLSKKDLEELRAILDGKEKK